MRKLKTKNKVKKINLNNLQVLRKQTLDNSQAVLYLFQKTLKNELENYLKCDVFFRGKYKMNFTNAIKSLKKGLLLIDSNKPIEEFQNKIATKH